VDEPVCELDGVEDCVADADCERVRVSEADCVNDGLVLPLGVPDELGVCVPLGDSVSEGVCVCERVSLTDGDPDTDAVSDELGD